MYSYWQYPYSTGQLVSPLVSHGKFNLATSTSLIDFTCRNTWMCDQMERLGFLLPTDHFCTKRQLMPGMCPVENPVKHRIFKPKAVFPITFHNDQSRSVWREPSLWRHHCPRRISTQTFNSTDYIPEDMSVSQHQREPISFYPAPVKHDDDFHHNSHQDRDISTAKPNAEDSTGDSIKRHSLLRCPYCHVTCSNNGQMKGHIRVHTGEKPYHCGHFGCGKAFARNEELTRHKRIHTGVKPYACDLCQRRFGRKDHLNKHKKIHLKVKQSL